MLSKQTKYYIAINQISNVGSVTAKRLIAACGSAEAIFTEKRNAISKIDGIGDIVVNNIFAEKDKALATAEHEMEFIDKNKIRVFIYTNDDYPRRLRACDDSPVIFFAKGDVDFNAPKIIGIVGTRKCTSYGTSLCEQLITDLAAAKYNPIIVSGLAYGIDICAHKTAMQNGLRTIAVMGTGLNVIYPAQHRAYAKQILETGGAIITEFISQTKVDPSNFLRRNRIIAGIADAVVVGESGEKGGALVTADIAMSYNRDVMTFPARVGDEHSKGCNKLIKTNKAALIEGIADLEYVLGWQSADAEKPKQLPLFNTLTETEMRIVTHLKNTETDNIDNISRQMQIPMSRLSAMLLTLEFNGYIKSLPGKMYALAFK